jgi:hypothetical protein
VVVEDIHDRLRRLEDTVSRQVLPKGYIFKTNDAGDLLIERSSDLTTVVVFSG